MKLVIETTKEQDECNHAFPSDPRKRNCTKCGLDYYVWYLMPAEALRK